MHCTGCKYPETEVVDTRSDKDSLIRRRRQCKRCGLRFTTLEAVKPPNSLKKARDINHE
jgi:transcriptional repressor NrdR